jgi:hypothetical protein
VPARSDARKQFLFDVFVTALEGGIGYWSVAEAYHWTKDYDAGSSADDLDGFYAIITDEEGGLVDKVRVDARTIARGIGVIQKGGAELHLHDSYRSRILGASAINDSGEIDAGDADIIVQAGLFNEVVYG